MILDLYFSTKNDYVLDNKNNVGFSIEKGGWYQHSILNNRCLNFCTAITKKDLLELGGFDERFSNGLAYGDNEFILRITRKNMNKNADLLFNKVAFESTIKVHNSFL